MIRMYGADLIYYRKFNTFFQEGEENTSNLIYGEDTTAEYYLSGDVRAFLDISTYNWLFNAMGYEAQENINIFIGIEDFKCRFATLVGKTASETFDVPVTGNMLYNEFSGTIDIPEFYATINGEFNPQTLFVSNVQPEMKERSINSQFYKSLTYKTLLYPISGTLEGQLYQDEIYPNKVSGVLSGELSYHTFDNIENSPTWQIAPQVGDFFKLKIGEIEEEYEITQVFDKILTNSAGINPLLGKYVFQCAATRRAASHEEFNMTHTEEILDELNQVQLTGEIEPEHTPAYTKEKINCEKNEFNEITNSIAKNIYNYNSDNSDYTYGGYQDV